MKPYKTPFILELQVHEEKSFAALPTTASTRQRSFVQEPTSRSWDPIDNLNMLYLEKLRDRDTTGPSKDFIQENRVIIKSCIVTKCIFSSFLASSAFCRLLITFTNSLDPYQDQKNVGPDLDPNMFDTLIVFLK